MKTCLLFVLCAVGSSGVALAQTPNVVNGTVDVRALSGTLDREFDGLAGRITGAAWIGYAIGVTPRRGDEGCWSNGDFAIRRTGPLKLEGSDTMFVLVRVADRRVDQIRIASSECPLDAGGLTVHWLTGVTATASLDWLSRVVSGDSSRRLQSQAIVAIALHADPPAIDRLLAFARNSADGRARSDALFWIAQRAGDRALGAITDAIDRDPDTEVKKKAVFALSQMPKDEGVPRLIDVARTHRNTEVRRQAMFWLGQSGDPRALAFFETLLK